MAADGDVAARLRVSAMNALARREHSRAELERKLGERFPDARALVHQVLDRLAEQGLQSDQRYVESFCRARVSRGQGYYRIRNELRQRGVGEALVDSTLQSLGTDWFELAREVAERRFGGSAGSDGGSARGDAREVARRMRFLRQRGFSQDQIQYALECLEGRESRG